MSSPLVEHYFRHEYGRLVAALTRHLGVRRLDLVEDVVQAALLRAMQTWSRRGVPADPAGWLFAVARHAALDALRRDKTWQAVHDRLPAEETSPSPEPHFPAEIADDQLRMLFVCCHEAVPAESQIALALKTLCGFNAAEIARGLLTTEANIRKRLTRAKEQLRAIALDPGTLAEPDIQSRLEAVHTILYLLFNEGYNSSQPDELIRLDLCQEAVRLGLLLAEHPLTATPVSKALLALMLLHAARFDARLNHQGELLLLEEQDRTKWDLRIIHEGLIWLGRSGEGNMLSRYHLEAAIAAEHCIAPTFAETNWPRIVAFYEKLYELAPTPVHALNRAIAVAHVHGPQAGLASLLPQENDSLRGYQYWHASLGELHRRLGQTDQARQHFTSALRLTTSQAERDLLLKRLVQCDEPRQ
jgi:RNA polymerase sigma-70 factor (ECF subfamily)